MIVDVGPHEWDPARRGFLRWLLDVPSYCRYCYLDKREHPVTIWAEARALGDRTIRRPRYMPYGR